MEHDEIEDSLHLAQRTIENVQILDSALLEEIVAGQIRKPLAFETPEKFVSATPNVQDARGGLNTSATKPFPLIWTRVPLRFPVVDKDLRKEPAEWILAIERITKALVVEEKTKRARSLNRS